MPEWNRYWEKKVNLNHYQNIALTKKNLKLNLILNNLLSRPNRPLTEMTVTVSSHQYDYMIKALSPGKWTVTVYSMIHYTNAGKKYIIIQSDYFENTTFYQNISQKKTYHYNKITAVTATISRTQNGQPFDFVSSVYDP